MTIDVSGTERPRAYEPVTSAPAKTQKYAQDPIAVVQVQVFKRYSLMIADTMVNFYMLRIRSLCLTVQTMSMLIRS